MFRRCELNENMINILIDDIEIARGGLGLGREQEKRAAELMKKPEFSITIELNIGKNDEWITTCDLTHDYVSINADYRS